MDYCIVYVTCKDSDQAKMIARDLLESKLVACANILPQISSIYQWQGEICEDQEAVLLLKTLKTAFRKIEARVKELHSYECPCVIAFDIGQGSEGFLKYIEASVIS